MMIKNTLTTLIAAFFSILSTDIVLGAPDSVSKFAIAKLEFTTGTIIEEYGEIIFVNRSKNIKNTFSKNTKTKQFRIGLIKLGSNKSINDVCDEYIHNRMQIKIADRSVTQYSLMIIYKDEGRKKKHICKYTVGKHLRLISSKENTYNRKYTPYKIDEMGIVEISMLNKARRKRFLKTVNNILLVVPFTINNSDHTFLKLQPIVQQLLKENVISTTSFTIFHLVNRSKNDGNIIFPVRSMPLIISSNGKYIGVLKEQILAIPKSPGASYDISSIAKKYSLITVSPTLVKTLPSAGTMTRDAFKETIKTGIRGEANFVFKHHARKEADYLNAKYIDLNFSYQAEQKKRVSFLVRYRKKGETWEAINE